MLIWEVLSVCSEHVLGYRPGSRPETGVGRSRGAGERGGAAALWGAGEGSGQCHSCCPQQLLHTESTREAQGAEGGAQNPSKETVCGLEAAGPPPGPALTEGSEVPEGRALTGLESLTFIFRRSFPETV